MSDLAAAKADARSAALARRAAAWSPEAQSAAQARLQAVLGDWPDARLAGYVPMRDEIDPLPVMTAWSDTAPVCVPVVHGAGRPLAFRAWSPSAPMVAATFGTRVPADGVEVVPELLIVPLLAFDRAGYRLGYGGGFYDRTLAGLRAAGPVRAVGFAFAAQETDALPTEPTDAPLDAVITDREVLRFAP